MCDAEITETRAPARSSASQWPASYSRRGTRLDGIPLNPRATYIVVASHPLDMAVSLYHQGSNNRPGQDARADLAAGACQAAAAAPAGAATHVVLVHYDDLCADLAGEMRGLAAALGIAVPERAWPAMSSRATRLRRRSWRRRTCFPGCTHGASLTRVRDSCPRWLLAVAAGSGAGARSSGKSRGLPGLRS